MKLSDGSRKMAREWEEVEIEAREGRRKKAGYLRRAASRVSRERLKKEGSRSILTSESDFSSKE